MGLLDRINSAVAEYAARRGAAGANGTSAATGADGKAKQTASQDDDVTLGNTVPKNAQPRLPLGSYKSSVGQDLTFVKETLRHKIAEYGLNPALQLQVKKSPLGQVELDGSMPADVRERINRELNQNRGFVDAFSRLSVGQPTLNYVDNVMKLSKAYGTANNLLQSVVSRDDNFNGLHDIAHRLDAMRNTLSSPSADGVGNAGRSHNFQLQFNVRA